MTSKPQTLEALYEYVKTLESRIDEAGGNYDEFFDGTTVTGDAFRVRGHNSDIGNNNTASGTQNVSSGTAWGDVSDSITLGAGTWVLVGRLSYASNSSGRRGIAIYNNTAGSRPAMSNLTAAPVSGAVTSVNTTYIAKVSANTSFCIQGYQNSGSSLSTDWYMSAVRIA